MIRLPAAAVLALFLALPAAAQDSGRPLPGEAGPPPPPAGAVGTVVNPAWISKATGEDFAKLYPMRAQEKHVSGAVMVLCAVTDDGRMGDCKVLAAEPQGYGFEAATLKIMGRFRMKPLTADGKPTAGGTFGMTVRWNLR